MTTDKIRKLTDKKLAELAKDSDVEVTNKMTREDVEKALIEKLVKANDGATTSEDLKTPDKKNPPIEKPIPKSGKCWIQYIGGGSLSFNGVTWRNQMSRQVDAKEARVMIGRFGHSRFAIK